MSTCGYQRAEIIYTERRADSIIDLAREVENASESAIVISELTARNDDYCDAVKAVNKRLNNFATKITRNSSATLTSVQKDLTKVNCTYN